MALEHLLAALERETAEEVARAAAAARAAADALTVESAAVAARERASRLAAHERTVRASGAAALASARQAARREVLEARHAWLERVRAAARARLPAAAAAPVGRDALRRRVAAALACVGGRPATLRCHPVLVGAIRAVVRGRPDVTLVADVNVATGFRLEAGGLSVDGTVEQLLERRWPALSMDVLREVEGQP